MKRLFQILLVVLGLQIGLFALAERVGSVALYDADLLIGGVEAEVYVGPNLSAVVNANILPNINLGAGNGTLPRFTVGAGALYFLELNHQGVYGAARVHWVKDFRPMVVPSVGYRYFFTPSVYMGLEGGVIVTFIQSFPAIPMISISAGYAF